jgi:nucleoside-diphosphate-sugar epimerase
MSQAILVAGATGNFGMRIVKALGTQHAEARVLGVSVANRRI